MRNATRKPMANCNRHGLRLVPPPLSEKAAELKKFLGKVSTDDFRRSIDIFRTYVGRGGVDLEQVYKWLNEIDKVQ